MHGFQAASLSRILAQTGVTKGALYYHFSGKQMLGYAVLDDPTMPIIGEGDEEPNDTYVEQLVASARSARSRVAPTHWASPSTPLRLIRTLYQAASGATRNVRTDEKYAFGVELARSLLADNARVPRNGVNKRGETAGGFIWDVRTWPVDLGRGGLPGRR